MGVLEPIYLYATWPDAVYACINKKEACAPEEIRKKSICVEADIGAAVIVGICIYFIGVSFQHGYELQKEADEIL